MATKLRGHVYYEGDPWYLNPDLGSPAVWQNRRTGELVDHGARYRHLHALTECKSHVKAHPRGAPEKAPGTTSQDQVVAYYLAYGVKATLERFRNITEATLRKYLRRAGVIKRREKLR
jgi:hypothetical protein